MTELYTASRNPHGPDTRPTSKLAITSLILSIPCLVLGPIALLPLILGIIGITKTGDSGSRKGQGFAITGTVLGGIGLLGTIFWLLLAILLPALGSARHMANLLKSETQVRSIVQGVFIYAESNNDQFPPVENWEQTLLDMGLVDTDTLLAPIEDMNPDDGISYIYLGGENTFSSTQIVIYEDPKHWPNRGVIVGFADGFVDVIPFDDFEQMLEEQQADSEP